MCRDRNQLQPPPSASTRALAAMLALLIFGLHLLTHSPAAHAWLHRVASHKTTCVTSGDHATPADDRDKTSGSAPHQDATCVVSLFAQGIIAAPDLAVVAAPHDLVFLAPAFGHTRPLASAPDRLHPPAHAPPPVG